MRPYQKSAVQYRLHGGFFSFDHNNKTGKYRILGMDDTDRGTSYYWKSPPSTCQTDLRRLSTLETEARRWKKRERRAQWRRRPAWECSCVSFRDGESQSCRIEVYWGASVPIYFSALLEEKGAWNHREVRHGIRPNPLWRRDREGRLDGNCQIQRAKSTSKRFWSYNIYSNDMTDLQKI